MPTYAQKQDMIDRYAAERLVELTDRADTPTGQIDDVVLGMALGDADGLIDSFLGARYQLPLAAIPGVLRSQATAIAYYTLHRDRYTDEARKGFEDAMAYLKSVANGMVKLDVGGIEPTSTAAIAQVSGPDRVFSRDTMKGY